MDKIPPPSISDSFYYGFSNWIALLLLIFTIGISFLLLLKKQLNIKINSYFFNPTNFNFTNYNVPIDNKKEKLRYPLFYIFCGIFLVYWLLVIQSKIPFFGERGYFLNRLFLMQDSLFPHQNFGFAYGRFLLDFPFYISKFLHVDIINAYQIAFLVESFLSYCFLWYIIQKVTHHSYRNYVFLGIFILSYIGLFVGGCNYTLFRFVTPLFLSILFYKYSYKNPTLIKILFYSLILFFCSSIISPELGIVALLSFWAGLVIYHRFSFSIILKSIIGMFMAVGLVMSMPILKNSYTSLFILSSGGFNFPWFFSPTILCFFIFIFISLVVVLQNKNQYENPILIVLCFAIFNLPAAMGRCDIGHLFYNGLGFFIIGLSAIPFFKNYTRKFLTYTYIFLLAIFTFSFITLYSIYIKTFIKYHLPSIPLTITYKEYIDPLDKHCIENLVIKNKSEKPLLIMGEPFFFQDSFYRKGLSFPFYVNNTDNFTDKTSTVLLQEIKNHSVVILHKGNPFFYPYRPLNNLWMIGLFGMPTTLIYKQKNNPNIVYEKIVETLNLDYYIDSDLSTTNYLIYKKRKIIK